MTPIEMAKAQAELPTLIHQLAPGEELTITENGIPVARLITTRTSLPGKRLPGAWLGKAEILQDDDDHLAHFAEYMK